ncbi:MAG: FkbM family methyltransferase, partial [Gammaproteobacteria bacterium]|nr:FkbM family methyltransferase [Gammaproteobacteria bacterium]
MNFISYAQNFEDIMLWRALKHVEKGFYIDIGAQDPVVDSVSMGFYEQGWRGVNVEPTKQYSQKLRTARPDEVIIQSAIGKNKGEIEFYEIPDTGLSTADREIE